MRIRESGVMFIVKYLIRRSPSRATKYACTYIFITEQLFGGYRKQRPQTSLTESQMPNSSAQ